ENGSHTTFRYDVLDRLIQETGFDGRTQRYHHDLTGKLIRSEDEGLVTISANLRVEPSEECDASVPR
ncbi:hypothetical protein AB6B43_11155, partial [Escherichia coli]